MIFKSIKPKAFFFFKTNKINTGEYDKEKRMEDIQYEEWKRYISIGLAAIKEIIWILGNEWNPSKNAS